MSTPAYGTISTTATFRRPFETLKRLPSACASLTSPRGSLTVTSFIVMPPCSISRNASLFDFARPAIITSSVFGKPALIFAALTDADGATCCSASAVDRAAEPQRRVALHLRQRRIAVHAARHLVGQPALRRARRRIVLQRFLERVDLGTIEPREELQVLDRRRDRRCCSQN